MEPNKSDALAVLRPNTEMTAVPALTLVEPFNPDTAAAADWAQMYRSFGIQVVPAYGPYEVSQWKRPCLPKWAAYQNELVQDELFDEWYGPQGRYRTRQSMGLLTGAASNGLFIIDLDTYKGNDAKKWWNALLEVHSNGIEIETPRQITGGGGIQLVFRAPAGWTPPTNRTSIGVDIRGKGGFAVLPPSPHLSGTDYAWAEGLAPWETKIATAPDWLCSEIDSLVESDDGTAQHTNNDTAPSSSTDSNLAPLQPASALTTVATNSLGIHNKITDGREWYMHKTVLACLKQFIGENGTAPTPAELHAIAWPQYQQKVQVDIPGKVTRGSDEMMKKCAYTVERFERGEISTMRDLDEALASYRVDPARQQPKQLNEATDARLIKSSGEFVANFTPPDYMVDGLMQQGFLYSLTGATGAGKTCITLRLAASTALGVTFAKRETKKMRVLYLAAENPDDVRMRWTALSQHMHFDVDEIEVYFVEGSFKITEMSARLKREAAERGGEFGLIVVDTGPVFYQGDDENNRTQQGKHAEMMRGLIDLIPGRPTVIVNCHPVKNAAADNLLPAGGGNFLNQVDGNFTAAKTESTTELHWQGKFRGVEFAPMHFMLKTVTHERLKDSRGRLIPTVICEWISDTAKEQIRAQKAADEDHILALIAADPSASQASLATKMGWRLHNGEPHKVKVGRCLRTLERAKLVRETRAGNYRVTPEGEQLLKQGQAA